MFHKHTQSQPGNDNVRPPAERESVKPLSEKKGRETESDKEVGSTAGLVTTAAQTASLNIRASGGGEDCCTLRSSWGISARSKRTKGKMRPREEKPVMPEEAAVR